MGCYKHPPIQTQHPRCIPWDCGVKQTNTPMGPNKPPHRSISNRVNIVRFRPKGAFRALRHIYKVKRSPYLYNIRNFSLYSMWDVTNTPPCKHNVLVVFHGMTGPNRQTPHTGPNKPPHQGQRSVLIPFVTTRSQPCRYCPFWAQRGSSRL